MPHNESVEMTESTRNQERMIIQKQCAQEDMKRRIIIVVCRQKNAIVLLRCVRCVCTVQSLPRSAGWGAAWVKSEAETPTIADQSSTCDVVCVFYLKDFKTATEDSFLLAFPCCEETEAGF